MDMRFRIKALAFAGLFAHLVGCEAGQAYVAGGIPGGVIGWSESLADSVSIRMDFATLGTVKKRGRYNSIPYEGQLDFQRAAVLADWFFWGRWRLTSGLSLNRGEVQMHFQGSNSFVTVNGVSIFASQADQLDAKFIFPDVSPYIGLGFGLKGGEKGWGISADIGAIIGQPKMTYTASPSLILKAGQSNVEQEMESWNAQARKVRAIPQLTMGVSYSF